jgi:glucose-1-phosphate adenylyltransferase
VRSSTEAQAYWRDVGTLDAYWGANIDLCEALPALDLYDQEWPIWTFAPITPPAKTIHDEEGRRGEAINSLLSGGCIVSGASVRKSLLFTGVRVHSYAQLSQAVVLPKVEVARSARLTKVIVDRGVRIPEGLVVGEAPDLDAQRFRRTDDGVCLITQRMIDKLSS